MVPGWPVAFILFMVALSIGVIANNPRYVFAITALAIFGFLVVGFFLFPRTRSTIPFRLGPATDAEAPNEKILVSGLPVSPSEFAQHFICALELKLSLALVALGLLSLCSFCFLVSHFPLAHFVERHFFESIYAPSLAILAGLWFSMKWYSEQTLLSRSVITLGIVTGINSMGQHRVITYEFRDPNGGYYGGRQRDFVKSRPVDHVVFVVYDRSNPDNNYSSRGFAFRNFRVYPLSDSRHAN